jgi:hypothetical protein
VEDAWEWQDGQFRYALVVDQDTLLYSKHLRHGGHIPTDLFELLDSVRRNRLGKPQEGEERIILDLRTIHWAGVGKVPYRGYSAFRMPPIIITGILCVAPMLAWRGWENWGCFGWAALLGPFAVGSLGMTELLARIFPHVALVLVPADRRERVIKIDLHGLVESRQKRLFEAFVASRRASWDAKSPP